MNRDEIVADRAANNLAEFVALGPGLRHSTRIWVIAKDIAVEKMLLGGLGSLGVGRMWSPAEGWDEDPTYAEAPELSWRESTELGGGAS